MFSQVRDIASLSQTGFEALLAELHFRAFHFSCFVCFEAEYFQMDLRALSLYICSFVEVAVAAISFLFSFLNRYKMPPVFLSEMSLLSFPHVLR